MKRCPSCRKNRSAREYRSDGSRKDNLAYICTSCEAIGVKAYAEKDGEVRVYIDDDREELVASLAEAAVAKKKAKADRREEAPDNSRFFAGLARIFAENTAKQKRKEQHRVEQLAGAEAGWRAFSEAAGIPLEPLPAEAVRLYDEGGDRRYNSPFSDSGPPAPRKPLPPLKSKDVQSKHVRGRNPADKPAFRNADPATSHAQDHVDELAAGGEIREQVGKFIGTITVDGKLEIQAFTSRVAARKWLASRRAAGEKKYVDAIYAAVAPHLGL